MSHLTRRQLLAASALAPLAWNAGFAAESAPFFRRHRLPIGLQIYTLAELATRDLQGTLAAVAKIGYRDIELAGFSGRTGAEFRKALDAAGLTCSSAHIPATSSTDLSFSGDLGKLSHELHAVGATHAIMPIFIVPERLGGPRKDEGFGAYLGRVGAQLTVEDWQRNAAFLNEKAATLKREGLRVGYHNHNPEFAPLPDGRTGLDVLLKETDPALVEFELDAGWVTAAGHSPFELLKKYPQRFALMHVKDIKRTTVSNFALRQDPTEVGSGMIDWSNLLGSAYAAGVRRFFVEQEPPFARDRLDAVRISYEYLSRVTT